MVDGIKRFVNGYFVFVEYSAGYTMIVPIFDQAGQIHQQYLSGFERRKQEIQKDFYQNEPILRRFDPPLPCHKIVVAASCSFLLKSHTRSCTRHYLGDLNHRHGISDAGFSGRK